METKKSATILLVSVEPCATPEATIKAIESKYPDFRQHVKRGDLIENTYDTGERAKGVYMYDGKNIIELDYDMDDYGHVTKEFLVFKEFNPNYWCIGDMKNADKKVNNVYVPDGTSKFYWHSFDPNLIWIAIEPLKEDLKYVINDVENDERYIFHTFENVKYKIIISEFPTDDQVYGIGGTYGDNEIVLGCPY